MSPQNPGWGLGSIKIGFNNWGYFKIVDVWDYWGFLKSSNNWCYKDKSLYGSPSNRLRYLCLTIGHHICSMINFAGFEVRERLHHGRGGRAWHSLLHSCKDEAEEGGGCGLKEGWWDVFFFCRFSFGSLWMDLLKVGIYMGLWFAVIYIYIEREYCWNIAEHGIGLGIKIHMILLATLGGLNCKQWRRGHRGRELIRSRPDFPRFLANATVCQFSIIAIRNDHL